MWNEEDSSGSHVDSYIDDLIVCKTLHEELAYAPASAGRTSLLVAASASNSPADKVLVWLEIRGVSGSFDWWRLNYDQRKKPGEDSPSQTSHHEEGNTNVLGTCQLLAQSHSIVCGDHGTVE